MSNASSELKKVKRPRLDWAIFDGLVWWFVVYRLPQYFVSELVPSLMPILPQAQNPRNIIVYLLLELTTIGLLAVVVRLYGLGLASLGLGQFKLNFIPKILLGYLIYFGLTVVILLLARSLTGLNVDEQQQLDFEHPTVIEAIFIFGLLSLVVPLAEELLFRGFLQRVLRSKLNFVPTALIVSVLFALVHGTVGVGLDVFALSLVLCYLREKTGSLWPGIALHALKNSVAFFILFIYNG